MKVIYNGNIVKETDVHLGINNRGLNYGDGLFETILADENRINFLEDHLMRLHAGLTAMGMDIPLLLNYLNVSQVVKKLRKENDIKGFIRIKIIVWRKSGGLFSPISREVDFLISILSVSIHKEPKQKVIFYDKIRLCYSPISRFKKISAITYVMAGIFMKESDADEVILLDTGDHVGECLASNIFWIKENIVYTPTLETGCLEGVMRKQIIRFLIANKIELREGKFKKADLMNADFVFSSNAAGIVAINNIEGKEFQEHSGIFERLTNSIDN